MLYKYYTNVFCLPGGPMIKGINEGSYRAVHNNQHYYKPKIHSSTSKVFCNFFYIYTIVTIHFRNIYLFGNEDLKPLLALRTALGYLKPLVQLELMLGLCLSLQTSVYFKL